MNDIDEAIRLSPTNARYRIARAVAMLRQGRAQEALADLEFAKITTPQNGHLLFVQFRVLNALGRTDEATAALTAASQYGSYAAKYEIARRRSPDGNVTVELSGRP